MRGIRFLALASTVLLGLWLACCGPADLPQEPEGAGGLPASDLRAQAAAEATAIIEQAQATALVFQAQSQATALVLQAQAALQVPDATPTTRALPAALPPTPVVPEDPAPSPPREEMAGTGEVTPTAVVELLSVGFGAEGAMIVANYKAPVSVAQAFWPGVLSITDEASGTVYTEVPVMPVIGPLIARPVEEGQMGYVMLVHAPPTLHLGSLVTVKLAGYTFEHVPVE